MKKIWILLIVALALIGCGQVEPVKTGENAYPVITLWHPYQGEVEAGLNKARQELDKANPPYRLELVYIAPDQYFNRIKQALAAGKGPDLIIIDLQQVPELYTTGVIKPMDGIIEPNKYFKSAIQAATFNGNVFAVPRTIKVPLMVTNKDLIANVPATWEILLDQGNKITQGKTQIVGGDFSNLFLNASLFSGSGAKYFTQDLKPDLSSGEMQTFLRTIGVPGKSVASDDALAARKVFQTGTLPFSLIDSSEIAEYKNSGKNIMISAVPNLAGKDGRAFVKADGYALIAASKHSSQAGAIAEFLTVFQAQNLYSPTIFPALQTVYEQKPYLDNPEAQLVKRLAATGSGYPIDSRSTLIMPIISMMIKDTVSGIDSLTAAQTAQAKALKAFNLEQPK